MIRIGHGYDLHRMKDGKGLVLSGINIECEFEMIAHSDGDVIIHAFIDSMLGALALGDIGALFPDTDEAYKGADSSILLKEVYKIIKSKGYALENADITVIAERPKLRKHIEKMRARLASIIDTEVDRISIKATTNEGLGEIGRGQAIACHSVCILKQNN